MFIGITDTNRFNYKIPSFPPVASAQNCVHCTVAWKTNQLLLVALFLK